MDGNITTFTPVDTRDEGQRRMDEGAEALMALPEVYAKLHAFDDACQPDRQRRG
jgi:hypothetical protein